MTKPKAAFTLIKMIGVFAIIAILASLVIPEIMERRARKAFMDALPETPLRQSVRVARIGMVGLSLGQD